MVRQVSGQDDFNIPEEDLERQKRLMRLKRVSDQKINTTDGEILT